MITLIDTLSEKILLIVFIMLNITLYYFSYSGATFLEGADSSQYYGPALSFLESGEFIRNGELLTFGTPLYSIFLAIPIFFFGISDSAVAIVIMQCILLYLTGFLSKYLLFNFSKRFGLLLHALVVFNPNSLITAHLVQSETLFTFLFIWSIVVSFKIITNFSLKNIILLGVLTGLASLTRPIAIYLLLSWPLFILIALIIRAKLNIRELHLFDWKKNLVKVLGVLFIGGIVVSPWYIRNYIEFNELFFTSNSGTYLKDQYMQLKNKGSGWDVIDAKKEHKKLFIDYLQHKGESNFCLDNERHWSCNVALTHVSLTAIQKEPLTAHIKTLIDSWGTLFLSGGASNIRNYLGFDGKSLIVNFQTKSFNGLNSVVKLVKDMNFPYFLIFIFTTSFSIISRVLGFVGIFFILKNKEWHPYGLLLVEVISIFTAAYLYLGQSRFRVPL